MEYYLALKRKEILTGYNMDALEDIMVSEITHSEKDKHSVTPLYEVPNLARFRDLQNRHVVFRPGRRSGERRSWCLWTWSLSFGKCVKFWEWRSHSHVHGLKALGCKL